MAMPPRPGLGYMSADLAERLRRTPGANTPQGLFLRHGGPGARDPRPNNMARAAATETEDLVERLGRMLRGLTNLNVRQPSHTAPPYRATSFISQSSGILGPNSSSTPAVTFNGNAVVPEGVIAEITHVKVYAFGDTPGATFDFRELYGLSNPLQFFGFDVLRNGSPIPGWQGRFVSSLVGMSKTTGAGILDYCQALIDSSPMTAPIHCLEGETYTLFLNNNQAVSSFSFVSIVAGYYYPIELGADGVRGTLADRG